MCQFTGSSLLANGQGLVKCVVWTYVCTYVRTFPLRLHNSSTTRRVGAGSRDCVCATTSLMTYIEFA